MSVVYSVSRPILAGVKKYFHQNGTSESTINVHTLNVDTVILAS
jgi:hypothetical protein